MAVSIIENSATLPDWVLVRQSWGKINSTTSITKHFTTTQRFLLILASASASRNTMYIVNGAGSTSNVVNLGTSTKITVDVSTPYQITLSTSETNDTYAYVLMLNGTGEFT